MAKARRKQSRKPRDLGAAGKKASRVRGGQSSIEKKDAETKGAIIRNIGG